MISDLIGFAHFSLANAIIPAMDNLGCYLDTPEKREPQLSNGPH